MLKINDNFTKLPGSYLFSTIAKKVKAYKESNPNADVISLGIGDVTRPLAPKVIEEMHNAVNEMANETTFRGYPPELGYDFLRQAVLKNDFEKRGVMLDADEIFISDGAKSDTGNIGDLFDSSNIVAVCDPVYPVYVDTNVMAGRAGNLIENSRWSKIVYMTCTEENGFVPQLPKEKADIIYLCFPNNPTGMTVSREQLKIYVDYAIKNGSIILYDSAYERFITDDTPHSIFEIEGAKSCAIEFRSFSKTAGFTGVRCGYTVVPKQLEFGGVSLNKLWARRQSTKFNGVSYITQRGAAAIYTEEGSKQINDTIAYYQNNAKLIYNSLKDAGYSVWGGKNAPYIWLKTPDSLPSWDFFDALLEKAQVVGTPGVGFGPAGEGYFRLTAFGSAERTAEAIQRILKNF